MTLPVRTEERASQAVVEAAPTASTPKRVTGLLGGAATAARPEGHCLRCGHRLRDRANYCTGCGSQVSGSSAEVQAPRSHAEPKTPPAPKGAAAAAAVDAVRDQVSRPARWLRERLASLREGVAARRADLGNVGSRVALARPPLSLVAGLLLLGSFTLFALTARLLVGLSSGQLVFIVAGAAILSGFASTVAVLASADRRTGLASAGDRLRTLDELLHAGRISAAEHDAHRATVLASVSGLDGTVAAKPTRSAGARAGKAAAGARPSPTPAR